MRISLGCRPNQWSSALCACLALAACVAPKTDDTVFEEAFSSEAAAVTYADSTNHVSTSNGSATATSTYNSSYTATHGIDGSTSTSWQASSTSAQYYKYIFNTATSINEIKVISQSGYTNVGTVYICTAGTYCDDFGTGWQSVGSISAEVPLTATTNITGIRLYITWTYQTVCNSYGCSDVTKRPQFRELQAWSYGPSWEGGTYNCNTLCSSSTSYDTQCRDNSTGNRLTCGTFGVYANSCRSACMGPVIRECSTSCQGSDGGWRTCNSFRPDYPCQNGSVGEPPPPDCAAFCSTQHACESACMDGATQKTCGTYNNACTPYCNYTRCDVVQGTVPFVDARYCSYNNTRMTCVDWGGGSSVNYDDKDLDRVPDTLENQLAAEWFPTMSMDPSDGNYFYGTPYTGTQAYQEPTATLPFIVRPAGGPGCTEDLQCLEITYILYFDRDYGDCDGISYFIGCIAEHVGDSETHSVLLSRKWVNSAVQTWNTPWSTAKDSVGAWKAVEMFAGSHQCVDQSDSSMFAYAAGGFSSEALIYTAKSKHGSYFTPDFCDQGSFANSDNCNDTTVIAGMREQSLTRLRNVGEQWAHTDPRFSGYRMAHSQRNSNGFFLATGANAYDVWSGNRSGYDWTGGMGNADSMLYRFKRGYINWYITSWEPTQNMHVNEDRYYLCEGE